MIAFLNPVLKILERCEPIIKSTILSRSFILPVLTSGRELGLESLDLVVKRLQVVVNCAYQAAINVAGHINIVSELGADAPYALQHLVALSDQLRQEPVRLLYLLLRELLHHRLLHQEHLGLQSLQYIHHTCKTSARRDMLDRWVFAFFSHRSALSGKLFF